MRVRVIKQHPGEGPFPTFAKGTAVTIGEECARFPHWYPCTILGCETYVPESFVHAGELIRDYNPTELVAEAGDVLEVQSIVYAWLFAVNQQGVAGWIPAESVLSESSANPPTDKNALNSQLNFLAVADKMKNIFRQTKIADGSRYENDAEHSWHFALTAMTLFEYCGIEGVNINRVIKMALVHDLVEIYAGDTFAYDEKGNESKGEREKASADKLFAMLPDRQAKEYRSLWEEFDRMETPDAIYASAIDCLQPFRNNHLTGGHTWIKHSVTADKIYKRMKPVKDALPDLWEYVEHVINEGLEKGYIKPE